MGRLVSRLTYHLLEKKRIDQKEQWKTGMIGIGKNESRNAVATEGQRRRKRREREGGKSSIHRREYEKNE